MKIDDKIKIDAVNAYISGMTRVDIIAIYKIHPVTLWRWVKQYQEGGIKNLTKKRVYKRPWNKFPLTLEEKVVALKEMHPSLSISKACKMLKMRGLEISRKGIWNVWRRYGLVGFMKDRMGIVTDCRKYCYIDPESRENIKKIKIMLSNQGIKNAAHAISLLPVCSEDKILHAVPKNSLSLKRQVDLLLSQSGKIPLRRYRQDARILRTNLEKKKLYYSALRVGIEEGAALTYLEEPQELLKLTIHLRKKGKGLRDPWLRYTIALLEGYALASLLRIQDALKCANECKILIRNLPNSYFLMGELTSLYYKLGKYREAIHWARKALEGVSDEYRKDLYSSLLGYLTVSGDYQAIPKISKQEELHKWGYHTRILLCKALFHLNKGDFQQASSLANEGLLCSKKEESRAFFFTAIFILACGHAAVGEKKKAQLILRKYNPLAKKYHLEKVYFLHRILLQDLRIPKEITSMPSLRLAQLLFQATRTMHTKDYMRALSYANTQELRGLFERLALFFPEPVVRLIKKGKNPGLSRIFLKMPIFQIEPPVYNLRFLGRLRIFKGEKSISRLKLGPKDRSFLIHLAINENRSIVLDDLYKNFWPRSRKPSRNLSHLLVRIRKSLSISSDRLKIRGDFLVWNFYFTTDHKLFEETLIQAKALDRTGEWRYAKREYQRAFALFRGEPFRKMYDNWSDHMRRVILNKLETEALHFAKSCLEHDNEIFQEKRQTPRNVTDARKALEKVAEIIPDSEEIRKMRSIAPLTNSRFSL